MAMTPTVSVIMPSYNSEKFIGEAIRSVLQQTFEFFELIVIDGGSKDGTCDIVRGIAKHDDRVVLIMNERDDGPAHARCLGIRRAKGQYVAFLDADDFWLPQKLHEQVKFMQNTSTKFCYSRYRVVSEDGRRIGCLLPMRKKYDYNTALAHRGIGTLTVVVDRSLLSEDVISVWLRAGGEEYLWWLLILKKGITAHLADFDAARYRNTAGSLSKNQRFTLSSVWKFYRKNLALPFPRALSIYLSYLVDVSIRRLRMYLHDCFNVPTSVRR